MGIPDIRKHLGNASDPYGRVVKVLRKLWLKGDIRRIADLTDTRRNLYMINAPKV